MDEIFIHNTLTGAKERFVPLEEGRLGLYCCGPTVYNFAHIGNLRSYLFEDVLRRAFAFFGYEVRHVMNITDVGHLTDDADEGEDKMVESARRQQKSVHEIADFYSAAFFSDCERLNILRPHVVCRATDHINDMIALVRRIEESGYAYVGDGNVYFDTAKFEGYGLGGRAATEGDAARARVGHDSAKRNAADFVLWFTKSKYHGHAMMWDSPWGRGYPGWHLECSAMSLRYLGERFDMHCGGIDHVPVHHTNEIAQVESVTGKRWVNYWVHGEFLLMGMRKASKSTGNFVTLSSLAEEGVEPLDFRYLCLGGHYRSQLRFSLAALTTARNARARLVERVARIVREGGGEGEGASAREGGDGAGDGKGAGDGASASAAGAAGTHARASALSARAQALYAKGKAAMANDLNSPQLLSVVWEAIKEPQIAAKEKLWLVGAFDTILGLKIIDTARDRALDGKRHTSGKTGGATGGAAGASLRDRGDGQARADARAGARADARSGARADDLSDGEVNALVEQRRRARLDREWQVADDIRDRLRRGGVTVVDTADGCEWFRS